MGKTSTCHWDYRSQLEAKILSHPAKKTGKKQPTREEENQGRVQTIQEEGNYFKKEGKLSGQVASVGLYGIMLLETWVQYVSVEGWELKPQWRELGNESEVRKWEQGAQITLSGCLTTKELGA